MESLEKEIKNDVQKLIELLNVNNENEWGKIIYNFLENFQSLKKDSYSINFKNI